MPRREHTAEMIPDKPREIIDYWPREAEVIVSSGGTVVEAALRIGVSERNSYRWRTEYGGLRVHQPPSPRLAGLLKACTMGHCKLSDFAQHPTP